MERPPPPKSNRRVPTEAVASPKVWEFGVRLGFRSFINGLRTDRVCHESDLAGDRGRGSHPPTELRRGRGKISAESHRRSHFRSGRDCEIMCVELKIAVNNALHMSRPLLARLPEHPSRRRSGPRQPRWTSSQSTSTRTMRTWCKRSHALASSPC